MTDSSLPAPGADEVPLSDDAMALIAEPTGQAADGGRSGQATSKKSKWRKALNALAWVSETADILNDTLEFEDATREEKRKPKPDVLPPPQLGDVARSDRPSGQAMNEFPPPPAQAPRQIETSGKAVASLVLSFIGLGVGSILAIIYGRKAKKEIAESKGWLKGKLLAAWGIALGWIGLGVAAIWCLSLIVGAVQQAHHQRQVDAAIDELFNGEGSYHYMEDPEGGPGFFCFLDENRECPQEEAAYDREQAYLRSTTQAERNADTAEAYLEQSYDNLDCQVDGADDQFLCTADPVDSVSGTTERVQIPVSVSGTDVYEGSPTTYTPDSERPEYVMWRTLSEPERQEFCDTFSVSGVDSIYNWDRINGLCIPYVGDMDPAREDIPVPNGVDLDAVTPEPATDTATGPTLPPDLAAVDPATCRKLLDGDNGDYLCDQITDSSGTADADPEAIPTKPTTNPTTEVAHADGGRQPEPLGLDSTLLGGYEQNLEIERATGNPAQLDADVQTLTDLTDWRWTDEMVIALGASYCNNWETAQDNEITAGGKDDWARSIAPVLGIDADAARIAIDSELWGHHQRVCE